MRIINDWLSITIGEEVNLKLDKGFIDTTRLSNKEMVAIETLTYPSNFIVNEDIEVIESYFKCRKELEQLKNLFITAYINPSKKVKPVVDFYTDRETVYYIAEIYGGTIFITHIVLPISIAKDPIQVSRLTRNWEMIMYYASSLPIIFCKDYNKVHESEHIYVLSTRESTIKNKKLTNAILPSRGYSVAQISILDNNIMINQNNNIKIWNKITGTQEIKVTNTLQFIDLLTTVTLSKNKYRDLHSFIEQLNRI